jgi:pyroglutamyl-peptidase
MKLLVTGFEPFGGSKVNVSELVANRLGTTQPFERMQISVCILPVDKDTAPAKLLEILQTLKPEGVICLGEAQKRSAISFERVAVNLLDFRIADNLGNQVMDLPVVQDGPAAYFSTLPLRSMVKAVKDIGIPAELSMSAGTFLCNQVMYQLMHFIHQENLAIQGGFIHLPSLPEQAVSKESGFPSMALETSYQGIVAALKILQPGY